MAEDYFLKIDGIAGESQDERHRGEIEVDGWSFGGALPGAGQIGAGGGTGKFAALPFQFTAKVSKASPKLFQACATGQHLKGATLVARKSGERPVEYLKVTLTDVLVASYQEAGSSGSGAAPVDQVSLTYAKIVIEYREQQSDGTLGAPVTAMFVVKKNKSSRKKRR